MTPAPDRPAGPAGAPGAGPGARDAEGPGPGFLALGLDGRILSALAGLGYEEPTPVQEEAIPPLLDGRDLLAEAPTGTGKTAAFALPVLQSLATGADAAGDDGGAASREARSGRPAALVLTPTRELAMQVAEAVHRYGRGLGVRVVPVYGGQPIVAQIGRLARGVDVVVATPGRAVDHLDRGTLRLDDVGTVVLDEADEMLDMGFAEDLERILGSLPRRRQTALFSATISGAVASLAERYLRDPVRVRVRREEPHAGEPSKVRQVAYVVRRPDKLAALGRILDLEEGAATLVFARTRGEVDDLAETLSGRGLDAAGLHGGLAQDQRDRIMARFRDGALDVLVATDLAARGLDIEHVSHVVNFDVPSSPDTYLHRIGRTGRAGRGGVAITLVEPREHRLLRDIERVVGRPLEIAGLPTLADIREHRMGRLRDALREALVAGGHDRYRAVVEPLADEFDLVDIALAAVARADEEARGAEDSTELAPAVLPPQSGPGAARARGWGPARGALPRSRALGPRPAGAVRAGRPPEPERGADAPAHRPRPVGLPSAARTAGRPAPRGPRPSDWRGADGRPVLRGAPRGGPGSGVTRLFVGLGREAGIRPGDLVGAITHEAGLEGREIGAIRIADGFSLVEVPEGAADRVMRALRGTTLRGRQPTVRRERF